MKPIILKFSLLLLVGELLNWWLFFFSPFNIPDVIPFTPIKIDGLIIVGILLTTIILAQKEYLKLRSDVTIFKLTMLGTIICFISEVIFQTVRQPTLNVVTLNNHIYYFLLGVIGITIFSTAFSFLSAFQLKTKKTKQLLLMILGLMIITNIFGYLFPEFIGQ